MTLPARVAKLRKREIQIREKLRATQNARLVVAGLFFLALLIATLRPGSGLELPAVLVFLVGFSLLVWRSRNFQRHARQLQTLAAFYERQDRRRNGLAVERPWKPALDSLDPAFDRTTLQDLNLIGPHSVFTLLDETISDGGQRELAENLLRPQLSLDQARERQQLLAGLRRERWFFIRLLIAAGDAEMELSTHQALEFLRKPFLPEGSNRWLIGVLALWIVCLIGTGWALATGSMSPTPFVLVFFVGGFVAYNRIGPVFLRGVGLATHLGALVTLFQKIEERETSPELKKLLPNVFASRPSRQLGRFQVILNFLSAESHPLIYMLLNAVLPWAVVFSWLLERERRAMSSSFPTCLDEFHKLEALISLTFLVVYQTDRFPKLTEGARLDFKAMLHPLIPRDRVVANDFAFPSGKTLGLITGSNMSGKSTFLRTVGVNQTLANMGAPCFAQSFETTLFKLGTCIQVSDSLRDGFSYFYSEVVRLKALIQQVHAGTPTLFLIDEIFRGTNNRERQIGSRAVIRSLVSRSSVGFVSTHDLELTSLEDSLTEVQNLHFREEIRGDQMLFSYKLQFGPCPTTNALKIMEAAGLDLRDV